MDQEKKSKRCAKCLHYFDVSNFWKDAISKDGHRSKCISCESKQNAQYKKANKSAITLTRRKYGLLNKEKIKETRKKWRAANIEQIRANRRQYYHKNKCNPLYKLPLYIRNRIRKVLIGLTKPGSSVKELGCTPKELKQHLEKYFEPGMTWDNWSPTGWHIDHIKPLVCFDLTDVNQFKEVCHYTNLRPLWAKDNLDRRKDYGRKEKK